MQTKIINKIPFCGRHVQAVAVNTSNKKMPVKLNVFIFNGDGSNFAPVIFIYKVFFRKEKSII